MYCLKKRMITLALAGLLGAPGVWADTPAERVKQINEEIAVLSAQLQKLELEAKIANKEAEKQRVSGVSAPGGIGQATDELPVVRAIDGMDGKLVATLAMRGGMVQTVREGEKFGAWTTKTITVNAVTLARGKESVRVPFGNEPPAPSGSNSPTGPGPMGPGAMPPVPFGR
ncbi:MAG TPA: type IV pilus biogenesis protein PilP [Bryobacteraceae bacterium]|jgi:type IV pilus biogenesis protein PilP|nr:type IV pilus biogenesis protein PilP [Bryobacteraceae bacterium]